MTAFPVTANSVTPPFGSPHLEYQMYSFPGKVEVEAILGRSEMTRLDSACESFHSLETNTAR